LTQKKKKNNILQIKYSVLSFSLESNATYFKEKKEKKKYTKNVLYINNYECHNIKREMNI